MPSAESKALSPEFRKKLEYLRVVARSLQTGRFAALQRSKKLGRGIEFCDHRPYSPGDEFKDIDWNLYGRLDRFMVRLAREETELNLHLVVDCSASMSEGEEDGPSKATFASQVATALAYVALANLDRIHIHPFDDRLHPPLRPPRHKAQAVQVQRYLAQRQGASATSMLEAMRTFASTERSRGIAVVLSDFLAPEGWRPSLDLLRNARFDLGLIQVTAPGEHHVERSGEVLLQDCETGRKRRVRLTEKLSRAYREAFRAHSAALEAYARAHGAFYVQARTDQPFEELVLRTLRSERFLA